MSLFCCCEIIGLALFTEYIYVIFFLCVISSSKYNMNIPRMITVEITDDTCLFQPHSVCTCPMSGACK